MTHAVEGSLLFRRDLDRRMYLGLLQSVVERLGWTLMTFALMDNHVHLLVVAETKQLSAGLWWLHWRYAEYFKASYRPHLGHVFGGRPKTKPILTDAYFLAVARYIALNPVPVLCRRPEEHRWSAHRAIIGSAPPLPLLAREELLAWFGPHDAIAHYQALVNGADVDEHHTIRAWAASEPADRPPIERFVVEGTGGAFREANETWGYSLRELGIAAGISHTAVRNAIVRDRQ